MSTAVGKLDEMVNQCVQTRVSPDSQEWKECLLFAKIVIQQSHVTNEKKLLNIIQILGDGNLCSQFMTKVLPNSFKSDIGATLSRFGDFFGWDVIKDSLCKAFQAGIRNQERECIQTFYTLVTSNSPNQQKLETCKAISAIVVQHLCDQSTSQEYPFFGMFHYSSSYGNQKSELSKVLIALIHIEENSLLDKLVNHFITHPKEYSVDTVLTPIIDDLYKNLKSKSARENASFIKLLNYCTNDLKSRIAVAPEPPKTWSQQVPISCSCEDCRAYKAFLQHSTEQEWHLRASEKRRKHIMQIPNPDITFNTVTQGFSLSILLVYLN